MSLQKYCIGCVLIVLTAKPSNLFATAFKPVWVSGGEEHSMVLTEDGRVFTAGNNTTGQLGHDGDETVLNPVLKGDGPGDVYLEDISNTSAGWVHSLVLTEDNRVLAFGYNYHGQLGNGKSYGDYPNDPEEPTPVWVHAGQQNISNPDADLSNILQVAAGRSGTHSLAVDADHFVFAWGNDEKGQCGVGTSGEYSRYSRPQRVLAGQMGGDFLRGMIAVSGGEEHSMALTTDGFVYTWGDNVDVNGDKGKLGTNDDVNNIQPVQVRVHGVNNVGDLPNIVAISAGWDHCMALEEWFPIDEDKKGRVYTWGNNGLGYSDPFHEPCLGGRLGDGTTTDRAVPVAVVNTPSGELEGIIAISAGESHCLALDIEGKVWAWGDNSYAQLGNGKSVDDYGSDPAQELTPVRVVGPDGTGQLSNIVAISAGYWHNLAIDSDGVLWVWGDYGKGQLGLGAVDTRYAVPQRTVAFTPDVWNQTQDLHYQQIQPAVNAAEEGDVIVVTQGIYKEAVGFGSKRLTLQSSDPDDPAIVATTVINHDSMYTGAVAFTNNQSSQGLQAAIKGFKVLLGKYGIHSQNSDPLISNCLIRESWTNGIYADTSPLTIEDCTMEQIRSGQGIYCQSSDATISRCIIRHCSARGLQMFSSSVTLNDSTIAENGSDGIYAQSSSQLCVYGTNISQNHGTGIYSTDPLEMQDCVIGANFSDGVYCEGAVDISRCLINDNGAYGIWAYSGQTSIQSSLIRKNAAHGAYAQFNSSLEVINNWIVDNGDGEGADYGIYLYVPPAGSTIRNNTVSGNTTAGICRVGGTDPYIANCILWDNGSQNLAGTFGSVEYCCINGGHAGDGNISTDPGFIDAGAGNYHIPSTSDCVDGGTGDYSSETDIDGEPRRFDGDGNNGPQVDIGGDEFYYSLCDFDADGVVNFVDYSYLADVWQTTYPDLNLAGTTVIDEEDLAVLAAEWLWQSSVDTIPLDELEQMGMMGEGIMGILPLGMESMEMESWPQYTEPDPNTVAEVLDWVDEMWSAGGLPDELTEEAYLDFRGTLEDWLK